LVAGCGTGRHPITTALGYLHSNVLAVDLSRTSLAFAQRKAKELKVSNIRFAQADILKLGQLDHSFDIIECVGVLHHMASPEVGLKLLLERLKPGGFLRLGLYSELARQSIVRMRQLVSEMAFEPTLEGIRAFRHFGRESENADIAALRQSNDFYATSAIRDLVFHVQEHRFTIPQVSRMLDDHNLKFMGFMLTNSLAKADYLKQFPDDPDCTNLQNWHQFEQCNPNTFARMYQFWCQYEA
ncbi:MAG: class I SAM-dependent methyltransferase, partial [Methyloligellaceae bacterium]